MSDSPNRILNPWGVRTPYAGAWPERLDERTVEAPERWVHSACVLCANGCALDVGVKDGRIVGVRGRPGDRVNRGRLGPKGLHGWEANGSRDRLTTPLLREGNGFRAASWEEAMDLMVRRCKDTIAKYTSGGMGIYSSGQLFLEDYFTLATLGRCGLRTLNMDGNTRLCTATACAALRESFGSDGQPGSYSDVDVTDCILLAGHNAAESTTVLWARILDRLAGPKKPQLVVVDPRRTPTAAAATVHLAPRVGTNLALMNGLLHLIIDVGHIDSEFIAAHTVGFDDLAKKVAGYTPERVESITGVPAADLQHAAEILGTAPTLLSTVLQGFYQSNQATAASVQVNNLHLLRGLIGQPGSGLLQMNGQPTSQNTRETGCNGEFPCFANWQNKAHMARLAERWNVHSSDVAHWTEPAHAMEIFKDAEAGSIRFLWIIATNPAVSLPELHRVRRILREHDLFVVVQDAFMTETAELADLVLPAAIWGEKTGTFTNADRTVHLSNKAIEPPGEARPDLDIFLDFAKRMDFRDKDGAPLVKWSSPAEAFEHWRRFSEGWPCDYSALSYERLSGPSGIQWPCNAQHPDGAERLYTDHIFKTAADECESYGHDLDTGGAISQEKYKAADPNGRAVLRGADYQPPPEEPDEQYPVWLTTGRILYHFHTRTKTGRAIALNQAAPNVFAQVSKADAIAWGIQENDLLEIASRRGVVRARARIGDILPGHVFIPFHYGYWDLDGGDDKARAANELTISAWDPISEQPYFRCAAVRVARAPENRGANAAATNPLAKPGNERPHHAAPTASPERAHLGDHLAMLFDGLAEFRAACDAARMHHSEDWDFLQGVQTLAKVTEQGLVLMSPFRSRASSQDGSGPAHLRRAGPELASKGAYGALRDLSVLVVLNEQVTIAATPLEIAAKALRDEPLETACTELLEQQAKKKALLEKQIKHRAGQSLAVPQ